jgi:Protein of unknown function (DUF2934)
MRRPPEIDVVRRAYELWEFSGRLQDRDQEFYLQALQELQTALSDREPYDPDGSSRPEVGPRLDSDRQTHIAGMPISKFMPCIPTRGTGVPTDPDWLHELSSTVIA